MIEPSRDARILIVDDQRANVALLEKLLRRDGYSRVHGLTDARRAVDALRDFRPDIVLLDLHMPHLDGFQVMQQFDEHNGGGCFLPILVLTADATTETKRKALGAGATDFLTKPFDQIEVLLRVRNLLATRALHVELRNQNAVLDDKVRARTAELWDAVRSLEVTQRELRLSQEETVHRLSIAAEFRDDETSRHVRRMSRYCGLLAGKMGVDPERVELIRVASQMHDVGKIGIPDSILMKPGRLTAQEFEVVKTHTDIGYRILAGSTSELATIAADIAWTHHEKVDGTGYPRGLRGNEIPLEGRMAAVADVFDALTTDRVYRKAIHLPKALNIMRDDKGTHFDAEILDVFFGMLDEVMATKERYEDPSEQTATRFGRRASVTPERSEAV